MPSGIALTGNITLEPDHVQQRRGVAIKIVNNDQPGVPVDT
jgi:hypothetical protein